jgi:NAD(P)-dependent dehydrogenase (short-subunit alcohol dehydrogenase family)
MLAKDRFGRIDALANAAGITSRGGFRDATAGLWDRVFAINARASFLMMQEVIRDLTKRGAPGTIVNIQSTNAHCGAPDLTVYAASKGALQTLTKNAANAFLHHGIRVNGINLGWTVTPSEDRLQRDLIGEDWAERAGQAMPLGRLLLPDDAARMAVHLLGPGSSPLTGASIDLDQRVLGAPS